MKSTEIFSNEYYRLDFFSAATRAERVVFTYTEAGNRRLDGLGFGTGFLTKNGFDVVSVKSNRDRWYQDLPELAFTRVEDFLQSEGRDYSWRGGYGSSMGAYAAILFAKRLSLNSILAISPQFDITANWDRRWSVHAPRISDMRLVSREDVQPGCRYHILYDPQDKDVEHYRMFAEVIPENQLEGLRAPFAGHPAGPLVNASGKLKDLALTALAGGAVKVLPSDLRKGRSRFPNYYMNLADYCQRKRRFVWGAAAIKAALTNDPLNAEYNIRLSALLEYSGELDEAIIRASAAVTTKPHHPYMKAVLARLLLRKGMLDQARHFIELAIAARPDNQDFRNIKGEIDRSFAKHSSHST
jgi:tetratricopeptide (TPR) repeat protein